MCEKCAEIDVLIERYRRVKCSISDQLTIAKAREVIAKLEAQKATLHPKQGR
jgi:hypothetical protein